MLQKIWIFQQLALAILHNYFDSPIKFLDLHLAKFLGSAKPFFMYSAFKCLPSIN